MTPIEKNIIVIDEEGNEYEATYIKRAKGLVKNGRARFVSENKICLACPPKNILEDFEMKENTINTAQNEREKNSINYALDQIERIATQTEYLNQIISELRQLETGNSGDIGAAGKAEAFSSIVKCRETTNQQLLRFYEKMYDDLKEKPQSLKTRALEIADRVINNPTCDESEKELLPTILDTIRHLE